MTPYRFIAGTDWFYAQEEALYREWYGRETSGHHPWPMAWETYVERQYWMASQPTRI